MTLSTRFECVFGFEASTLKFTTTEHHDKSRSIRDHDGRSTLLAADLMVELVIRICRLLALEIHLQVTIRAAETLHLYIT